jgi:hypothetical protein
MQLETKYKLNNKLLIVKQNVINSFTSFMKIILNLDDTTN